MQIIQSIRDKGAAVVIGVIALSLIGFILMDARRDGSNFFSSMSSKVGKVNGEAIERTEFDKKYKDIEEAQSRGGQKPPVYQLREQTWNQIVSEKIFYAEAEKLGIELTTKELNEILASNEQSNPFFQDQTMRDSIDNTKLDMKKVEQAITNIKKTKGDARDRLHKQIVDPLLLNTAVQKYSGLLNASVYYPSWMQEKETSENKTFATISYVSIPYTDIADSTVKVTDEEINDYVKQHKESFKQDEETRSISYITFSQKSNGADSIRTRDEVAQLKTAFETDSNTKVFVLRNNNSPIKTTEDFVPKSKLLPAIADTLSRLPIGGVYGPYADQNAYVLAKIVSVKEQPDSIRAKHILVTEKETGSDAAAKSRADSIYNAILAGADFATMAKTFSTDLSNKDKGGDLEYFAFGRMVTEFNDWCFTKPLGSRGVVKTQFGYHVIEITGQKNFSTAYQIAYVGKEIETSAETITKASLDATKAAAEKTRANLEKYAAKNNLVITPLSNGLKENDYSAGQFTEARSLVQWAFKAKKGEVSSEAFNIGDQFVVPVLDNITEEGLENAATARPKCENTIRNKKKAEMIIKNLGSNPTLESAATKYSKQVMTAGADSTITFNSQVVNGATETKVVGAAFNKANLNKVSAPIQGAAGVYLIMVTSTQQKADETPEAMAQRITNRKTNLRSQQVGNWFEGLRKQSEVKDYRSKFF